MKIIKNKFGVAMLISFLPLMMLLLYEIDMVNSILSINQNALLEFDYLIIWSTNIWQLLLPMIIIYAITKHNLKERFSKIIIEALKFQTVKLIIM